jgi:hypothetical protein
MLVPSSARSHVDGLYVRPREVVARAEDGVTPTEATPAFQGPIHGSAVHGHDLDGSVAQEPIDDATGRRADPRFQDDAELDQRSRREQVRSSLADALRAPVVLIAVALMAMLGLTG